ncbi:MAG: adenylate/guanylate cyclase domain-containing protein, partial [Candidatus Eremiobacterota bacterium]
VSIFRLLDPTAKFFQVVPGKAVLIGGHTYVAEHQLISPLDRLRSFQAQACLLDTLLSGWRMRSPGLPMNSLAVLLLTALASWSAFRFRPRQALALFLALSAAFLVLNAFLFWNGWNLWLARPLLAGGMAFVGILSLRAADAYYNLRRFGGTVAERAARSYLEGDYLERAREKEASIVFCNIPDVLKQMENSGVREYFPRRREFSSLVNEVCRVHRGIVLDYQGDAQMLGFGVELEHDQPEHAYLAVRAALDLVGLAQTLDQRWWGVDDPALLKIRCGVATGRVAVGQVGSRSKKAQAAIGDTTNVAARLLGAARKQNVDVLVTEATRQACGKRFTFEQLAPVALKGKKQAVSVFSVTEE